MKLKRMARSKRGAFIAELAPTLFIVFVIMTFPLVAFGSLGTKYVMLLNCAKQSADAAKKCKYWSNPAPGVSNTVKNVANACAASFSGISLVGTPVITIYSVIPPASTPTVVPASSLPLASAKQNAIYSMQVTVTGNISPIIGGGTAKWFGAIPGLNAALQTSANATVVLESYTAVTNQN